MPPKLRSKRTVKSLNSRSNAAEVAHEGRVPALVEPRNKISEKSAEISAIFRLSVEIGRIYTPPIVGLTNFRQFIANFADISMKFPIFTDILAKFSILQQVPT